MGEETTTEQCGVQMLLLGLFSFGLMILNPNNTGTHSHPAFSIGQKYILFVVPHRLKCPESVTLVCEKLLVLSVEILDVI